MKYFIFFLYLLTAVFAFGQSTTTLKTNKLVVGAPSAVDKVLEFNTNQGSANPKIKANAASSKIQFAADGVNYKDIGSGSGGSGVNLIDNFGFETSITDGWTNSGGTYAAVTSGTTLIYQTRSAAFTPSGSGQYFEANSMAVPVYLYGNDCMAKISWKGADANVYMTVLDGSSVEIIPSTNRYTFSVQSGVKTGKLYFTCPSSGSVKLRIQSTASGVIGTYDQAFIGESDLKPVGTTTAWSSFTTGCSGSWVSNTTYSCKKRRIGDEFEYEYSLTLSGAPTATSLILNLPDSIDTTKLNTLNNFTIGLTVAEDVGVNSYSGAVGYQSSTQVLPVIYSTGGTYGNPVGISSTVPFTFGSTDRLVVKFKVPIVGLSVSEDSINAKCPTDISCENVFTAKISSSGTVSDENLDWINSNAALSTNQFTITFNSGIFTTAPNCVTEAQTASGSPRSTTINTQSSSSIVVKTYWDATTASADGFNIICQKTGSDFKARQNIQGFLQSTVTSSANNERMERAVVSTTSPTISFQSGFLSGSTTKNSTGDVTANLVAGVFSSAPTCTCSPLTATQVLQCQFYTVTTSAIRFQLRNSAGTGLDDSIQIICVGPR